MATTSIFGFGGWDPFTSFGEGLMNLSFLKQSSKSLLKEQYKYAQQYALNSPSWNVQGLRNANLNPILAATDGSFSSPTVPSVSSPDVSSKSSNVVDPSVMVGMVNSIKQTKSQVELQRAQTFKTFVDGLNDLKTNGFKSSTLADISNLASSLGFRDSEIQSILKAFGFDNVSRSSPNGNSTPSSVIKTRHHPMDSTGYPAFKPNFSDNTKVGRFFNEVDRQIYDDRKDATYKKIQERQNRNSFKAEKFYKKSNSPSLWFR